jgi:hypothetical protein
VSFLAEVVEVELVDETLDGQLDLRPLCRAGTPTGSGAILPRSKNLTEQAEAVVRVFGSFWRRRDESQKEKFADRATR